MAGCASRPLKAGVATCTVSKLAAGLHDVTAEYSGDGNFRPSSGYLWLTVGAGPPGMVRLLGASLRHLTDRAVLLAFDLSAAAPIKRVVVILPGGLSFSRRAARTVAVQAVAGRRLRRSARLEAGALVITLKTGTKRLHVSVASAIRADKNLVAKVRRHRVKALKLTFYVAGLKGEVAKLVAKVQV
jgi:hypothetical protein